MDDWQEFGQEIPMLVNLQPAGEYLGEDYYHAGGRAGGRQPADGTGAHQGGRPHRQRTHIGDNCRGAIIEDENVIKPYDKR